MKYFLRLRLKLVLLAAMGLLIPLLTVEIAFASSTPAQCYVGGFGTSSSSDVGTFPCNDPNSNNPIAAPAGGFQDDHCYKAGINTSNNSFQYNDVDCSQAPFTSTTTQCVDGTTQTTTAANAQDACKSHGGNKASSTTGACSTGNFLGLVPWYAYLPLNPPPDCSVNLQLSDSQNGANGPKNLNKLWLIALAIFEDLMRIAALVAIGFIIYGGIRYITSQGEPENIKVSLSTIVNAVIGLAITILGAALISFIANRLGAG